MSTAPRSPPRAAPNVSQSPGSNGMSPGTWNSSCPSGLDGIAGTKPVHSPGRFGDITGMTWPGEYGTGVPASRRTTCTSPWGATLVTWAAVAAGTPA